MKQIACLSFTIVLVFLLYIHRILNSMVPDYPSSHKTIPPQPCREHPYKEDPNCRNLLQTLLQGRWKLKDDITFKDFLNQRRTDMQMRIKKGWPPLLYHGDLRCGTKYPLPRVTYANRTEGYYLDIPSQCDIVGDSPCCRDDVGWCGNGEAFCLCKTCIDYRQFLPAELGVWETENGCNMRNVSGDLACQQLKEHFTSITFIGDSLVRHLFSSLVILLTRDRESGALQADMKQVDKEICSGENQFVDSACHKWLAMSWNDILKNPDYCSNTPVKHRPRVSFVEAYSIQQLSLAKRELVARLNEERPLVILGIGVHDNFNYTRVIKDYLSPIVDMKNKSKNKSTFVWLNTHSSGPLKPNQFRKIQGNERIKYFNQILDTFCAKNGIVTMDTFNFTTGIHSFDGTHYGFEINRLKTQILLNGLLEIISRK